jgi:hypothetical protein
MARLVALFKAEVLTVAFFLCCIKVFGIVLLVIFQFQVFGPAQALKGKFGFVDAV